MSDNPTASPNTADTIGRPIATSVPNVNARMIIAAAKPTISLLSVAGSDSSPPTEPPTATFMPAFTPGLPAARTLWAICCVSSAPPTSSKTGMNAVFLSLLICAAPCREKGSTTLATWGSVFSCLYAASIACFSCASVTFPVVVWKTSGLLPFCCGGKRAARRLVAAWLSVPGSCRLLLVLLPKPCASATRAAMPTIHTPSTTHFRRAAKSPNRCSARAMLPDARPRRESV